MLDLSTIPRLPLPDGTAPLTLAGDAAGPMLLGSGAVWRRKGEAWTKAGDLPLNAPVEGTVLDGEGRLWAWAGAQVVAAENPRMAYDLPGKVIVGAADGGSILVWLDGAEGLVSWRLGGKGKPASAKLPPLPGGARPAWLIACGEIRLALSDDASGFRLWRLDAGAWAPALEPGAGRHGQAPHVLQALSAGASFAVVVSGYGQARPLNPAAPPGKEVLLVRADGSDYELLVGEARLSPEGLKLPASLMGPDFDDGPTGAIAGIALWKRHLALLEEATEERPARLRLTAEGPDPSAWETFELSADPATKRLRPGLVPADDGLYIAASGNLFRLEI